MRDSGYLETDRRAHALVTIWPWWSIHAAPETLSSRRHKAMLSCFLLLFFFFLLLLVLSFLFIDWLIDCSFFHPYESFSLFSLRVGSTRVKKERKGVTVSCNECPECLFFYLYALLSIHHVSYFWKFAETLQPVLVPHFRHDDAHTTKRKAYELHTMKKKSISLFHLSLSLEREREFWRCHLFLLDSNFWIRFFQKWSTAFLLALL